MLIVLGWSRLNSGPQLYDLFKSVLDIVLEFIFQYNQYVMKMNKIRFFYVKRPLVKLSSHIRDFLEDCVET